MSKIAIYPGSFDPITNGHINLIERALTVFDQLIVAVAKNLAKTPLFTPEERVEMVKIALQDNPRIVVESFDGLLVDYLVNKNANVILRGLRAVSDFDYEFQMSFMNRRLHRHVETIFMMTGYKWFYVNSRIIKEVVFAGGSVEGLVPEIVCKKLREKYLQLKGKEKT
jgi:pantetheine-phosphate adenylyltransferase